MGIFDGLIASSQAFVEAYGMLGAFIIAFAESIIFPVPVAPFVTILTSFGHDPLLVTIVTTIGSVLGALVGYALGKHLGYPVVNRLFSKYIERVKRKFDKWGAWGVLIAAFTPIPFKVFTWASGLFQLHLPKFVGASFVGRFIQFAIAAYVGNLFGGGVIEWLLGF